MLAIKNNLMAETAARHLGNNYDALATSVERLSSGLRINSAKDDAAGLAVRELIRADIATLRQGARNAQDGISMLQTAEGALGAVDGILVRMKELAEQSATGSYGADQRALMDAEFQELSKEITRIAETTDFNDIKLLDSLSSYEIHVGTNATAETKISITGQLMDAGTLELSASKEKAVYSSATYASTDADMFQVTLAGDLSYTFGLDKDDEDVDIGPVTIAVTALAGEGSGVDTYTVQQWVDLVNDAAGAIQTGYTMASVSYNADTAQYSVMARPYTTGNWVNLDVDGGDATLTDDSFIDNADWATTDGTDTGVSIATQTGAIAALSTVDTAINTKDTFRAELGYMMNRLEAATQVVTIQAENLLTAESRISDVDVATEMAAMTRNQVLAQAGIAMLAQANTMPQMALQLMG